MKTSKKIKYNYTKEFKQIVEKINEFKKNRILYKYPNDNKSKI